MLQRVLLSAGLCMTLAGCQLGQTVEGTYLFDAMDAMQAGDRAGFRQAIAHLDGILAEPAPSDICSPEAYAMRRVALYRAVLSRMDAADVIRMTEEVRLVYF